MGEFRQRGRGNFGGGDSGRSGFPRKSFGGNRDRGPVTMHKVICDECDKECEVPFRPTDGKPVYCNDCFGDRRDSGNNRGQDRFPRKSFENNRPSRNDFSSGPVRGGDDGIKKQLEALNLKLEQIVKILESKVETKTVASKEKETKKATSKTAPSPKEKKATKKVSKKK